MQKLTAVDLRASFGSPFGGNPGTGGKTLGDLVTNYLKLSLAVAGVMLLFYLVFSGIKYISSANSSDPQAMQQGKQTMIYALLGFIVVATSYLVIDLIETLIGSNIVS